MMRYITAALQQDNGVVRMRATAYNVQSYSGIVIRPGAFRDSIDSFIRDGYILYQHDRSLLPLGHIIAVDDSDTELIITAEWYDHSDAQAVRAIVEQRIAQGKGVDVSIGYYVADDDIDYQDGVTIVRRGTLVECSIVLWGDNPEAEVLQSQRLSDQYMRTVEQIKYAIHAAHVMMRRVSDIKQLRAIDNRSVSTTTIQRVESLSQELKRLGEAVAQVRDSIESLRASDERLQAARQSLSELLSNLSKNENDTKRT